MSLSVITTLDLDMARPTGAIVHAVQRESSGRVIELHLLNNGESWLVPNNAYPVARYYKSDRIGGFYDTDENDVYAFSYGSTRDIVYLTLAYQVLTTPGNVQMKINFYDNAGVVVSTFAFTIVVEQTDLADEEITSSPYYNVLSSLIGEIIQERFDVTEEMEGYVEEAEEAKEYAQYFTGAPRTASTAAGMTDHGLIYVYTGTTGDGLTNGHWYYWDGTAWTDGGVYNATAFNVDNTLKISGAVADAKAVGDLYDKLVQVSDEEFNALKSAINFINDCMEESEISILPSTFLSESGIAHGTGVLRTGVTSVATDFIKVQAFSTLRYSRRSTMATSSISDNTLGMAFYDANKVYISGNPQINKQEVLTYVEQIIAVPSEAVYARFTFYTTDTEITGNRYIYGTLKIHSVVEGIQEKIELSDDYNNLWAIGVISEATSLNASTGSTQADSDYDTTDFIPVGGVKINVIYGRGARYWFYDENKSPIPSGGTGLLNSKPELIDGSGIHVLTVPDGAAYFRVCQYITNGRNYLLYARNPYEEFLYNQFTNRETGIKLYTLGDSITRGMYAEIGTSSSSGPTAKSYPYWIAQINGYNLINLGISGSGWANIGSAETANDPSTAKNAKAVVDDNDFSDADIITMAWGVNDWKGASQNVVLGDMASVSGDGTVIGNMKYCIETLMTKKPTAQLIVLLPLNTNRQWSGMDTMTLANNWAFGYAYRNSQTLQDYRIAIKQCAEYYNVKVIDLEEVCPINRLNLRNVCGDGLHPTKAFHKQMGQALAPLIC